MLEALISQGRLSLDRITLVGHSLGAHISGMIARRFRDVNKLKMVPVVVALDPAGIGYRGVKDSFLKDPYRLRKGDAIYMMVIHSSAFALGWEERLGDADYYPNYGFMQPCCKNVIPDMINSYGNSFTTS